MTARCNLTFEDRLDFLEGRIATNANDEVQRHLSRGCVDCEREVESLRAMLPQLSAAIAMSAIHAPEAAMARACNIFKLQPQPTLIERIVAAANVLFDSRQAGGNLAFARDVAEESVHVVYRSGNTDIDLWQERNSKAGWYLSGQALSLDDVDLANPSNVVLQSAGMTSLPATFVDGEFAFDNVPSGDYTLCIEWPNHSVMIEDLKIGFEGS